MKQILYRYAELPDLFTADSIAHVLQELNALFASEGQKVALFSGGALNKIYFGKDQQLSYGIDMESFAFEKSIALLQRVSETKIAHPKSSRYVYKG